MTRSVLVRLIAKDITNVNLSVTSSAFHYTLLPFVKTELGLFRGCIARECGTRDRDVEVILEEPGPEDVHWHSAVGIIINFRADFEQIAAGDTDATNFVNTITSACVHIRALHFVVYVVCGQDSSSCTRYIP